MKIVLINPPILGDRVMRDFKKFESMRGIYPPLGLLYIAAVLLDEGHEVRVIDCDAEDDHEAAVRGACTSPSPDAAGFYSFTWNYRQAVRLADLVKTLAPAATTILGGPNATSFPELSLRNGRFDIVVKSEGEETAKELFAALAARKPLDGIRGIAWKEGDRIRETENREFIRDLDSVSFPARHLGRMERYSDVFARDRKFATMIASRGCPFNCTFCDRKNRMGKIWRARTPENVIAEMRKLRDDYGIREVMFFDDNFILNKAWVYDFCGKLKASGLDPLWEIRTRADTVDEGVLRAIRDAGCYRIRFGFESGDNQILMNMKKGITVEQSRECARLCHKIGIEMFGYFILGAPGETEVTMEKTLDLAIKIEPRFALFSKYVPYPSTEAFEWAVANGYIEKNYWIDFLAGRDLDSHPALDQKQLPAAVVEKYMDLANRRFYFRPRYILNTLKAVKSPAQFWRYLRIAASLV